ncbi:MAG TPA: hypothetical protein VKZ53_09415 [Candidatus Angelobacter sp.]|nr:hypothetical protein [Candidatus Angelobacter sp.]
MRCKTLLGGILSLAVLGFAQRDDAVFLLPPDHPAIQYGVLPANDPVSALNRDIQERLVHLEFHGPQGYLQSVLEALKVPIESQMMVYSKTSFQSEIIQPSNPRALFFNDQVTVGYVHGGFIELATQDSRQGVSFYTLEQSPKDKPVFVRRDDCLRCHVSYATLGVPGMLVRSVMTASDGRAEPQFGQYISDHRSPITERWGGWYVTGQNTSMEHMGNMPITNSGMPESAATFNSTPKSLLGRFNADFYPSPYSDVVALMVFDHQMHMTNLLTQIGWEARYREYRSQIEPSTPGEVADGFEVAIPDIAYIANELVDYLLFVDEPSLKNPIQGTSGFAKKFSRQGPNDSKGRSLRQFDLRRRLMRYPCSYMIYSPAFDTLPKPAKDAIYKRMWEILSGREKGGKYAALSLSDRQAVEEILRETKKDLPSYFQPIAH